MFPPRIVSLQVLCVRRMCSAVSMCGRCPVMATTHPSWSQHYGGSCQGASVQLFTLSGLASPIFWKVDSFHSCQNSHEGMMYSAGRDLTFYLSLYFLSQTTKYGGTPTSNLTMASPGAWTISLLTFSASDSALYFSKNKKLIFFKVSTRYQISFDMIVEYLFHFSVNNLLFVLGLWILAVGRDRPDRLQFVSQTDWKTHRRVTQWYWCGADVDKRSYVLL